MGEVTAGRWWESERRKLGIDDVLDVAKQSNFQFGSKKNSEMFG